MREKFNMNKVSIKKNQQVEDAPKKAGCELVVENCKAAVALQIELYGEKSVQTCISLSNLCDAYLQMGDKENAMKETKRYLKMAKAIKDKEHINMAKEILADIIDSKWK